MSTVPASNPASKSASGAATAEAYLAQAVPKARKTLKTTRIVCVLVMVCVGLYIGIISVVMTGFFQPAAAAEVASGMLIQQAESGGPVLAAQLEKEIPALIRQAPDYLIKEIPLYRKELQQQLEAECQVYADSLAKDLGAHIDALINDHPDQIKALLENAQDREAIRKLLPDAERVIADFSTKDVDGRKLKQYIDNVAASLKVLEERMDRLANGKNLTLEEKKARRALATLTSLKRPTK